MKEKEKTAEPTKKVEYTKLKDITPNMQNINLKGEIVKVEEPLKVMARTMMQVELQNVRVTDDSIKGKNYWLVLWSVDVGKYQVGDLIDIQNAYITTYDGQMQIRLMKNSTINKTGVAKKHLEKQIGKRGIKK